MDTYCAFEMNAVVPAAREPAFMEVRREDIVKWFSSFWKLIWCVGIPCYLSFCRQRTRQGERSAKRKEKGETVIEVVRKRTNFRLHIRLRDERGLWRREKEEGRGRT